MLGEIHGYPIIAIGCIPDQEGFLPNRRIILIDKGPSEPRSRYVVARHIAGNKEWENGNYLPDDFPNAIKRFTDRWLGQL